MKSVQCQGQVCSPGGTIGILNCIWTECAPGSDALTFLNDVPHQADVRLAVGGWCSVPHIYLCGRCSAPGTSLFTCVDGFQHHIFTGMLNCARWTAPGAGVFTCVCRVFSTRGRCVHLCVYGVQHQGQVCSPVCVDGVQHQEHMFTCVCGVQHQVC